MRLGVGDEAEISVDGSGHAEVTRLAPGNVIMGEVNSFASIGVALISA